MVSNYTLSSLSGEKADLNVTKIFALTNDHVLISNEFSSKIVKLLQEDKKVKLVESDLAISALTTLDAVVLDDGKMIRITNQTIQRGDMLVTLKSEVI